MENDNKDLSGVATESLGAKASEGAEGDKPLSSNNSSPTATEGRASYQSTASPTGKTGKTKSLVKTFLWLTIVAALGVGGYLGWRSQGWQLGVFTAPPAKSKDVLSSKEEPSSPADMPWRQQLDKLAASLAEEREARIASERVLREQMADLQLQQSSQGERLRQLSTTSREDWLLAEAEYLLRLANQRLLMERQSSNALSLMTAADGILQELNAPELFAVRKALADDITRLRMSEGVDREGIYLRLEALIGSTAELQAVLVEAPEPPVLQAPGPAANTAWWPTLAHNVREAFVKMTGILRVERRDKPLLPMPSPSQQQLLYYNLRMTFEQAQLALMRGEKEIYAASLAKAHDLVSAHFEKTQSSEVFLEELDALQNLQIQSALPAVNTSIRALQDYIQYWHNRYPEPQGLSEATP